MTRSMNPWASFSSSPLFILMNSVAFSTGFVPSSVLLSKAREPQVLLIHRFLCILELERNYKMETICGSEKSPCLIGFSGFPITTSTLLLLPSSLPFGSKISKHGDKNCTGNQQLGTCSVNFTCWCISVLAKNSNKTNNNNKRKRNCLMQITCHWLFSKTVTFSL